MKIYLIARYERREELFDYKTDLEAAGHTVTSRWLDGSTDPTDNGVSLPASSQQIAMNDIDDLFDSEVAIVFTESAGIGPMRGGRHVEFGIALGVNMLHHRIFGDVAARPFRLFVVGPRENVFHCLPDVRQFGTWSEALAAI